MFIIIFFTLQKIKVNQVGTCQQKQILLTEKGANYFSDDYLECWRIL